MSITAWVWKMMKNILVHVIILFSCAIWHDAVTAVQVNIEPLRYRAANSSLSVNVMCTTPDSASLTGCQWSWWHLLSGSRNHSFIDLNRGAKSRPPATHRDGFVGRGNYPLKRYSYRGRGLEHGDCGVRLTFHVLPDETWVLSCRVKTGHAWVYQWMELDMNFAPGYLEHSLHPVREVVVLPGGQVNIKLTHKWKLDSCSFELPADARRCCPVVNATPTTHVQDLGSLNSGTCGLQMVNVSEEDNGVLGSTIVKGPLFETRLTPIIVAHPPSPPLLTLHYTNKTIVATCVVESSRPPPTFSWTLGTLPLLGDVQDVSPGEADAPWSWPWSNGSSAQRMEFEARTEDEGKILKCSVFNVAVNLPLEAVEMIAPLEGCGRRRTDSGRELISGGENAIPGEFPWHVGIFLNANNTYTLQCGGTLISPTVVISAAHCFWNNTAGAHISYSLFRVVAGIHTREWQDSSPGLQRSKIRRVDTQCYSGQAMNLVFDIALVFLEEPMVMTDTVGVVCMDWNSRTSLAEGDIGVVPGWGYTQHASLSHELKYINLTYISSKTCVKSLNASQQILLTQDKFCAGYRDAGRSVCPGDSGGGLVFRDANRPDGDVDRYYLKGVVSVDFRPFTFTGFCYSELYTAFTEVAFYVKTIQDALTSEVERKCEV